MVDTAKMAGPVGWLFRFDEFNAMDGYGEGILALSMLVMLKRCFQHVFQELAGDRGMTMFLVLGLVVEILL